MVSSYRSRSTRASSLWAVALRYGLALASVGAVAVFMRVMKALGTADARPALLVAIALYVPISPSAPFSRMFGTPDLARQVVLDFMQLLFWPLAGFLLVTAAQEAAALASARSRRG